MALLSVIRRWHFREHLSTGEICRRTDLSRNTIRKYLRADGVEPKFNVPERPSKLDPFADRLSAWLKTESKKGRKQKRTMKQLHTDLVSLGYEGSYNRVAAFAREWRDMLPEPRGSPDAHCRERGSDRLQTSSRYLRWQAFRCHRQHWTARSSSRLRTRLANW